MKTTINPLIISALLFFQSAIVLSQSLRTEVSPKKYNFSFSLTGGESFLTKQFVDISGGSNSFGSGINLNFSAAYFLSDSKAISIDAGYTFLKSKFQSFEGHSFSGGGASMYSFKGNFLIGRFRPEERLICSFSIGLGVHIFKLKSLTETLYYFRNNSDSTWHYDTYTSDPSADIDGLVSLGGSIGYRFIKGFGIRAEIEYNMITGTHHNYFPVRGGLFYMF